MKHIRILLTCLLTLAVAVPAWGALTLPDDQPVDIPVRQVLLAPPTTVYPVLIEPATTPATEEC